MSEMLIDGAKLDACNTAEADAIRAKTGGTDPIPYDYANSKGFADAIASIQTGGNKTLIADYTTLEDVFAIQVDFTSEMKAYDYYLFEATLTGIGSTYPCPQINATNQQQYYNQFPARTEFVVSGLIVKYSFRSNNYAACCFSNTGNNIKSMRANNGVEYFYLRQYYTASSWAAGSNVKIWGVTIS